MYFHRFNEVDLYGVRIQIYETTFGNKIVVRFKIKLLMRLREFELDLLVVILNWT